MTVVQWMDLIHLSVAAELIVIVAMMGLIMVGMMLVCLAEAVRDFKEGKRKDLEP